MSTLQTDVIIDVYSLRDDVGPILTPLFANPNIVKVLHGGDTDIALLISDLDIPVLNVFDTALAFREMLWTGSSYHAHNTPSFDTLSWYLLSRPIDKTLAC